MLEEVIKDLTEATDELRKEIEKLTAALKAQPGAATPAVPEAPKPQADDAPTEDLKPLALKLSRAGHKAAIRDKLDGYGAKKLDDLTAEQAVEVLGWLKTLGEK
jgi:hypothetical protein